MKEEFGAFKEHVEDQTKILHARVIYAEKGMQSLIQGMKKAGGKGRAGDRPEGAEDGGQNKGADLDGDALATAEEQEAWLSEVAAQDKHVKVSSLAVRRI